MYNLQYTNQFKKDLKRLKKRSPEENKILRDFLKELKLEGFSVLKPKNRLHKLSGKYDKFWECHILPDLLIIWIFRKDSKTIVLIRTGTHADLFE